MNPLILAFVLTSGAFSAPSAVDSVGTSSKTLTAPGFTINTSLTVSPLNPPVIGACTLGAGSLSAGTYCYQVTALSSLGETTPSSEACLTITSGQAPAGVNVNWTPSSGALGHDIYGRGAGSETLIIRGSRPVAEATWLDAGILTPTTHGLPTSNTSGTVAQLVSRSGGYPFVLQAGDHGGLRIAMKNGNGVAGIDDGLHIEMGTGITGDAIGVYGTTGGRNRVFSVSKIGQMYLSDSFFLLPPAVDQTRDYNGSNLTMFTLVSDIGSATDSVFRMYTNGAEDFLQIFNNGSPFTRRGSWDNVGRIWLGDIATGASGLQKDSGSLATVSNNAGAIAYTQHNAWNFSAKIASPGYAFDMPSGAKINWGGVAAQTLHCDGAGTPTCIFGANLSVNGTVYAYGASSSTFSDAHGDKPVRVLGNIPDGASAVGVIVDTLNTLTTAGSKILSVKNNGVEKVNVDKDGSFHQIAAPTLLVCAAGTRYLESIQAGGSAGKYDKKCICVSDNQVSPTYAWKNTSGVFATEAASVGNTTSCPDP